MHSTTQLGLPLLMPAQAQKHVTVNEALVRLDAGVQLGIHGSSLRIPPTDVAEGQSFLVPIDPAGEWQEATGHVAIWNNGGWIYLVPKPGWTAWCNETSRRLFFDGAGWIAEPLALGNSGAMTTVGVLEFDHDFVPGQSNLSSAQIPAQSVVVGVSGRVKDEIVGVGLSSWRMGVEGSEDRYGSGIGLLRNSYLVGITGSPLTYYNDTPLKLSTDGGEFLSGVLNVAIHFMKITPPNLN